MNKCDGANTEFFTDRVIIFTSVTVNELSEIDTEQYKILLGDHYDEFIDICDQLSDYPSTNNIEEDPVELASCGLEDGNLTFYLQHKSGERVKFNAETLS